MSHILSKRQFTVGSMLAFTTYIAVSLALVPLAFKTDFSALCIAILLLATLAPLCDIFGNAATRKLRPFITVLLGIAIVALVFQWLRYDPRFHWFRLALVLAGVIAAVPRVQLRIASRSSSVSLISFCLLAACFITQLISTRSDRYFVNRRLRSDAEPLETRHGVLVRPGGQVGYHISAPFRRPPGATWNPRKTFLDLFDAEVLGRPITKLRFLSTSDSIDNIHFADATNESDWHHLARQVQLKYMDFTRLQVSESQAVALESLRELQQLAFFDCDLPAGIAGHTSNSTKLWVLQLQGCDIRGGLAGLADNVELRQLNLRGTQITIEDLVQIARLPKLVELDLRDISLSPEMYTRFSELLSDSENAARRRGPFSCKLSVGKESLLAIRPLLECGALNSLEIHGVATSESELAALKSISPHIEITTVTE